VTGNIALKPIFVKYWGDVGAAWATFLVGVIYVVVTFYVFAKVLRYKVGICKNHEYFMLFYIASVIAIVFRKMI
jgi:Na+-driven multidrug efflux pump